MMTMVAIITYGMERRCGAQFQLVQLVQIEENKEIQSTYLPVEIIIY